MTEERYSEANQAFARLAHLVKVAQTFSDAQHLFLSHGLEQAALNAEALEEDVASQAATTVLLLFRLAFNRVEGK